jgi:hypothetical protein
MDPVRPELPQPVPAEILELPLERGYPVPWFVARVNGAYDFRVLRPGAFEYALAWETCWICGKPLGAWCTFVVGPMCAVNRTSAEPPSHPECAEWAAIACPFLVRPHATRRAGGLPDGTHEPDGIMLRRNPGVALCWHTLRGRIKLRRPHRLLDMGKPYEVSWFAHGRPATRAEIRASIESGLPALAEIAIKQGPAATRQLDKYVHRAMKLLPPR